ncbi:1974_t:CDS:1, partial [Scutellospora calospora]
CAKATLPRKKTSLGSIQTTKLSTSEKTKTDLKRIGSISQLYTKKLDLQISNSEKE